MAAVGRGEMKASNVARAMYPDYKEERLSQLRRQEGAAAVSQDDKPATTPARAPSAIPIRGINSAICR